MFFKLQCKDSAENHFETARNVHFEPWFVAWCDNVKS